MSEHEVDDFVESEEDDDEISNDEDEDDSEYEEDRKKKSKRKKPDSKRKTLKTKKKRKNETVLKFVDEEASEDDEEDDVSRDSEDEISRKEQSRMYNEQLYKRKHGRLPEYLKKETEEDIEEEINQRYQNWDPEYDEENHLTQQELLPTLNDPKLFAVRCRIGYERDAAIQLINKFLCLKGTENELQIYSASALDKFQGYIYVEADREVHVKNAIKGIGVLGYGKVQVVPIKEVTQVFIPDGSKNVDIQPGQWVRVKGGLYDGDIGKVDLYDDANMKVIIKLVPRIEMGDDEQEREEEKEGKNGLERYRQRLKKGVRPPQRFFIAGEHDGVDDRRTKEGESYKSWKGMKFKDGFLYKKFSIKRLVTKDVIPSLEEIKMFMKSVEDDGDFKEDNGNLDKDLEDIYNTKVNVNKFNKGDMVRVTRGDLINLIGTVINSTDNIVTIQPSHEELTDTMDFAPVELEKYFVRGDHVKVIYGKHEGQTGTILKIEDRVATLISEDFEGEMKVRTNDLKLSNEINTTIEYSDKYKKYDLVKLNDFRTVGCVIALHKESVTMVDTDGTTQNVKYPKIETKLNTKRNSAQNSHRQNIGVGSTVRVLDGVHKQKTGVVKHVYRDSIFIFNNELVLTAGIFVEKANNCLLLNSTSMNFMQAPRPQQNNNANQANNQGPPGRGGPMGQGRHGEREYQNQRIKDRNSELLGKLVVIIRGVWKGYQGRVKDIDDKSARVELTAKPQTLSLPKDSIKLANEDTGAKIALDVKTPIHTRGGYGTSPFHAMSPAYMTSPGWRADSGPAMSPAYESNINR